MIDQPHRLFQRQLKRYLGDVPSLPKSVKTLMQVVNETYIQFDQDRGMLERAFDLSSEEMVEANRELLRHRQNLERLVAERTRDLVQTNDRLVIEIQERQRAEKRLSLLNECLLSFGIDSRENIQRLIALCGSQLQASQVEYAVLSGDSFKPIAYWSRGDANLHRNPSEVFTAVLSDDTFRESGSDLSILHPPFSGPFQTAVYQKFSRSGKQPGILFLGYGGQITLNEADREYLRILITALQSEEDRRRVRAELHQSRKTLSFLAKSAHDGIVVTDQHGQVTYWNPAAERIFGYNETEVIGKPFQELLGPSAADVDYTANRTKLQRPGKGPLKGSIAEVPAIRKDGARVQVEISLSSSLDAQGEWYTLGIVRDITERKRWENSLKKAKEDAESASKAKSQFLANMSHEIRTPLNGILGMMELLSTEHLSDRQKRFLKMARSSGDSLLSVINDILDFSKIEAGRMELSLIEFNLHNLLEDLIGFLKESAHRKDLELAYRIGEDVPSLLQGDACRIRQILVNLVGNGIKFTEQGQVVVRVAVLNRDRGRLQLKFEVSDTGIGLSEEMQQDIFEAFSQGDGSVTRRFGGTGLGLAIAKQLAQMMGGTMGVTSLPGQGSTFWFTLVLEEQKVLKPEEGLHPGKSLEGLKVLVVEDNEADRTVLCHQLQGLGAEAEKAESGRRALHVLQSAVWQGNPYDFVILGAALLVTNGFDLAKVIQMDSSLDNLKLIVVTSPDIPRTERENLEYRVHAYLSKPLLQTELLKALRPGDGREASEGKNGNEGLMQKPFSSSFAGCRILLVEDNEVNQEVGKAMLESIGCSVEVASNGNECLERIAGAAYDVILMDCQMPELDGYEATMIIRQQESGSSRIPILALTAHAMEGDRDVCLAAGMDDYLSKPFTVKQLVEALSRLISPG